MICSLCDKPLPIDADSSSWVNEEGIVFCPGCVVKGCVDAIQPPPSQALPAPAAADSRPSVPYPTRNLPTHRIIVVEMVYHQSIEDQPTALETRFARWLSTDEQPYGPRRAKATSEWQPLDLGWIEEASMILLSNLEGQGLQKQPTDAERLVMSQAVLEVGMVVAEGSSRSRTMFSGPLQAERGVIPFCSVPPGETARFSPLNLGQMRVRSRGTSTRFSVTLLPI